VNPEYTLGSYVRGRLDKCKYCKLKTIPELMSQFCFILDVLFYNRNYILVETTRLERAMLQDIGTMWLIWQQDQYSISVNKPSLDDITTGALTKDDISIVSAKTVKTSKQRPIHAAAAAAPSKFRESDSSENDYVGTQKRRSKKNPPKPTKWVPPEENANPKWKPPPGQDQALAMTDVRLNLDGVTKNMGNLWLADLGASCRMTFSEEGMYNCREFCVPIKKGNGKSMIATKISMKKVTMVLADRRTA
jgi:hypothetical protein